MNSICNYSRKMTFLLQLVLILLVLSLSSESSMCQKDSALAFEGVSKLIDEAIDYVYKEQYDRAIELCEDVIQKHPENPMGYLGQAGIYHILMLNYRVSTFDPQFDSLTTLAIDVGNDAVKKHKKDATAYFVLGAAYGFRGLNRIRKKEWVGAFHDGFKGIINIKKAHKLDQDLYDTYYALGLFYYWKSVKAKVLTVLHMMKDEREKGINFLKIAAEKGRFTASESKFALVEIYFYEGRFKDALDMCMSMGDKFLQDPTWNYLMAKILIKLEQWQESVAYFKKILSMFENAPYKSYSYLSECHYGIAFCAFQQRNYQIAREELDLAIQLSVLIDEKLEIEGPLLDFDLVLKRMEQLKQKLANIPNKQ